MDVAKLLIVIELKPVPAIVMRFGDEVETVTVPAPRIEVVAFERPLIAVTPPVVEALAGVQKLPFHVRTWLVVGVVVETGFPWRPITVCDVELPERSPFAVKLPHPVQLPLITRLSSEVVAPVIVTVPGKDAVMPEWPMVIPVEDEAPIEMVLELSITTPESPEMDVPLNVSAARAGPVVRARMPPMIPTMRGHAVRPSSDNFIFERVVYFRTTYALYDEDLAGNVNPQPRERSLCNPFTQPGSWREEPVRR